MDKKSYLLKISGSIGSSKHREFEQTVRFVFNMLPGSCYSSNLTLDVFHPHLYHVLTLWRSATDLAAFKASEEFDLIKGSFRTLGYIDRTFAASLIDEHIFEITEGDNI
ncbi:hypothetical protein WBG78_09105 [Chryseolinea sp. T2]|uniref:hypothetical protein n=1 Tax=Chryseolinea sp. T2 TaxID=3129255 RepID=UPI0030774B07